MQDSAIVKRLIDLAGGPDASTVIIISTADEADNYDQYDSGLKLWRENGATGANGAPTRIQSADG